MFRSAVVVAIAGLLLADPILCRARAVSGPCAIGCRWLHRSSGAHSRPAEHGHDSTHGCICQGATRSVDGKTSLVFAMDQFGPRSAIDRLLIPPEQPDRRLTHTVPLSRWIRGRDICIERQSFLF